MTWRDPQDWAGVKRPPQMGRVEPMRVRLRVDFGAGEVEVAGRAWSVDGDDMVVYSDIGGWCTQYVKAWRPSDGARDEIDDDQDRDD